MSEQLPDIKESLRRVGCFSLLQAYCNCWRELGTRRSSSSSSDLHKRSLTTITLFVTSNFECMARKHWCFGAGQHPPEISVMVFFWAQVCRTALHTSCACCHLSGIYKLHFGPPITYITHIPIRVHMLIPKDWSVFTGMKKADKRLKGYTDHSRRIKIYNVLKDNWAECGRNWTPCKLALNNNITQWTNPLEACCSSAAVCCAVHRWTVEVSTCVYYSTWLHVMYH